MEANDSDSSEPVMSVAELMKKQRRVVFHTGNIASKVKMPHQTTTDEIITRVEGVIRKTADVPAVLATESCSPLVRHPVFSSKLTPEERDNQSITLKVFVTRWKRELVLEAVHRTLLELGVSFVDLLVVGFPQADADLDHLKVIWEPMEQLSREGVASSLGSSELDVDQLKCLNDWASVKPKVNQVNLAYCCKIPEDLARYAKQSNIELYTHNDEREIFPETRVQDMLAKALGPEWAGQRGGPDNNDEDNNNIVGVASGGGGSSTAMPAAAAELGTGTGTGVVAVSDNEPWHCSWVARYSTVIKMRGIMSFKGYLVCLEQSS